MVRCPRTVIVFFCIWLNISNIYICCAPYPKTNSTLCVGPRSNLHQQPSSRTCSDHYARDRFNYTWSVRIEWSFAQPPPWTAPPLLHTRIVWKYMYYMHILYVNLYSNQIRESQQCGAMSTAHRNMNHTRGILDGGNA